MKKAFLYMLLFTATQMFSQNWELNLDKAKTLAKEKNQKILIVFQGSDWCAPCMKLDKNIWSSETFKLVAKENYVLVQVDFPRRKKNRLSKEQQSHNHQLAMEYNRNGIFPLVVVLNSNGELLGKTGYKKLSPQEYINHLESF